jgi:hypothetical protein
LVKFYGKRLILLTSKIPNIYPKMPKIIKNSTEIHVKIQEKTKTFENPPDYATTKG